MSGSLMNRRRGWGGAMARVGLMRRMMEALEPRVVLSGGAEGLPEWLEWEEGNGPFDYYRLEAQAGMTYVFEIPGVGRRGGFQLMSGDDQMESQWADDDGRTWLVWQATQSGVYSLEVVGSVEARAALSAVRTDALSDDDGTTDLVVGENRGEAHGRGDTDQFRLRATEGYAYRFKLGTDVYVDMHTIREAWSGHEWGIGYGQTADGSMERQFVAPATGEYILDVTRLDAGPYSIEMVEVADDEVGAGPRLMGTTGTAEGSIDHRDDRDRFAIEVVEGMAYAFEVSGAAGAVGIEVLDEAGFPVQRYPCAWYHGMKRKRGCAGPPQYNAEYTWVAPRSGRFFVEAATRNWYQDPPAYPIRYEVNAAMAPANAAPDVEGARPLTPWVTTAGVMGQAGEVATFAIEATRGAEYGAQVNSAGGWRSVVRVLAPDGATEVAAGTGSLAGWVATYEGTHYVVVSGFGAGEYELQVVERPDDQGGEPGELANPGAASGSIDYGEDVDTFRLKAEGGTVYLLTFAGDARRVSVVRDGTGERWDLSQNGGGVLTFDPSEADTYVVRVEGSGEDGTARYSIGVAEAEDDYVGPAELTINQRVAGRFDYARDVDSFQIHGLAGVVYGFEFEREDGAEVNGLVAVYDEAGREVWSSGADRAAWLAESDQVYTVSVRSYSMGDYAFIVTPNPDDVGDLWELHWSGERTGTLEDYDDMEYFWFAAGAGKTYLVEVEGGSAYADLATGDLSRYYDDTGSRFRWQARRAGVYVLMVTADEDEPAFNFTVRIREVDEEDAEDAEDGEGDFLDGEEDGKEEGGLNDDDEFEDEEWLDEAWVWEDEEWLDEDWDEDDEGWWDEEEWLEDEEQWWAEDAEDVIA